MSIDRELIRETSAGRTKETLHCNIELDEPNAAPLEPERPRQLRTDLLMEIERLRDLIRQLVFEVGGDKPYARPPTAQGLECIYCEYEWDYGSPERHDEHCPIRQGRLALRSAGWRKVEG